MSYDHWKTTNPDDEFLGPDPLDVLESSIQQLLIAFVNATGCEIAHVRVDTRNFANLRVEVSVRRR
jgi:hypothetical protein